MAKRKTAYIKVHYTGYLFYQDTFYVGTIKGIGKIYQQAGIDAYSSFGFAKFYTNRMAIKAINFLKTKVLLV